MVFAPIRMHQPTTSMAIFWPWQTQKGLYSSSIQTIDNLSYTYQTSSNKLAKVADAGVATTGLGDFTDGTNIDDDYSYDDNGNLTIDKNKSISSITYNILNLPEQISVTGKGTISYEYACPPRRNAAGNKLSKTVDETGQPQKVTTYLGGLIFETKHERFTLKTNCIICVVPSGH